MTTTRSRHNGDRFAVQHVALWLAVAATIPGILVRLLLPALGPAAESILFGLAIVGAAFLLSWAAEVAQLDVSRGLAIAALALIAVLPEYAVDLVFAWKGGSAVEAFGAACQGQGAAGETPCALALANMTGANRLLIGIGWSMVVFIAWWRFRRRPEPLRDVRLSRGHSIEIGFLALATVYSLTLPLKHSVTPIDALVLVAIFVAYTVRVARGPAEEPDLVGPARIIGNLPVSSRRTAVLTMFAFSAGVIVLCAEPFAHALVETGHDLGVSEFLLVQWVAPLASEAPELLVAGLYAWRLQAEAGLATLVSSKVNQWTLLVGTLPVVFAIAAGGLHGLPIEPRQRQELFLTAAQSFFAVSILASLSISTREALLLFGLFWAQFVIGAVVPASLGGLELVGTGVAYLLLGGWMLARNSGHIRSRVRDLSRARS